MAPFNKREVGYIKALAGVGKHKTYIHSRFSKSLASDGYDLTSTSSVIDNTTKKVRVLTTALNDITFALDSTDISGNPNSWSPDVRKVGAGCRNGGALQPMQLLSATVVAEKDEGNFVDTSSRVGPDFYLGSTHLRLRFTMPGFAQAASGTVASPHAEYRLIIFRGRKPQTSVNSVTDGEYDPLTAIHGSSFLNFHYDLFNGYTGRPVGMQGWRSRQELDGTELYHGYKRSADVFIANAGSADYPPGEDTRTADDLMTLPINDADYIVMKDERFFLGAEHGKSHYETNVRWDWTEKGTTDKPDMAQGLPESFNTNWMIMLIGTYNSSQTPDLHCLYRGTTYAESA